MKKASILFLLAFFGVLLTAQSQESKSSIPSVNIRALDGTQFNTGEIHNDGKPFVISFWATWCKPCVRELTAISELYEDWQEETGVKIFAICVDDARTSGNVLPFISAKSWEFDFYLDTNSDFKRAMNVNLIPHTFILNGAGEVVKQHTSYSPGDEDIMYETIKSLIE